MEGKNKSRDRARKKLESHRCHLAAKGERCQNLTGGPQPRRDTKINRNGLI